MIAATLRGSWRERPPPAELDAAEIRGVSPLLLGSGAASLGWWRLKASPPLDALPEAEPLRQAARLLALEDISHRAAVAHLSAMLRAGCVTALIFKGWAASQFYAETYLRPYGDLDILVRPEEYDAALAILASCAVARMSDITRGDITIDPGAPLKAYNVDLHAALPEVYRTDTQALFARAMHADPPHDGLLVPAPEDHLRIVIAHMLRHGAWRPLWLCDVAAMVEAAGPEFDWTICLTGDEQLADWIRSVIIVAHRLLDCRVEHLPASIRTHAPPKWIERAILKAWRAPYAGRFRPRRLAALRDPRAWLAAHWPSPLQATFRSGGGIRHRPHIAFQIAVFGSELQRAAANVTRTSWWKEVRA